MNKNLKILIASVLMITTIGIVGCTGKGDKPATDNNQQVTEDENKEETKGEDTENGKDENKEQDKEKDKDKVEDKEEDKNNSTSSNSKPEEKPQVKLEEKPETKLEVKPEQKEHSYTVYYMDSTASFLEKKTKKGEKEEILKPWSVLWQLQEVGPLNKNVKVNSFTVNNENIAVIDLSKEMYYTKLGSGPESLMIESMAKTFMSAYETDGLIIKVDGKLYSSGHIILEEGKYFK